MLGQSMKETNFHQRKQWSMSIKKYLMECLSCFDYTVHTITIQGRPGGVVEYQYTRKKIDKIPQIPPNIPKNNRSFEYFIPEIQRKWYTEYPYLSCNIPYTRFKTPLNTEYPKTLADPDYKTITTCSITAEHRLPDWWCFTINVFFLIANGN